MASGRTSPVSDRLPPDDFTSRIDEPNSFASEGEENAATAIANELVQFAPYDQRSWSVRESWLGAQSAIRELRFILIGDSVVA